MLYEASLYVLRDIGHNELCPYKGMFTLYCNGKILSANWLQPFAALNASTRLSGFAIAPTFKQFGGILSFRVPARNDRMPPNCLNQIQQRMFTFYYNGKILSEHSFHPSAVLNASTRFPGT